MKKYLLFTALLGTILLGTLLWLSFDQVSKAENTNGYGIFSDFATWQSSSQYSGDQVYSFVTRMPTGSFVFGSSSRWVNGQKWNFEDINADGLPDFWYYEHYHDGFSDHRYVALFLNNGQSNFDLVYKCVHDRDGVYYGNCAAGASQTYEPNMLSAVYPLMLHVRFFSASDTYRDTPPPGPFLDLNGDGLTDLISADYSNSQIIINDGTWNF